MVVVKEKWFSKYVDEKLPDLASKVVAVTGSTSGTGFWVVVAAIRKNARCCILLNRPSPRVQKMVENLQKEKDLCNSATELIVVDCDLGSFESTRRAAEEVNEIVAEFSGLDVLINNAGIYGFPDDRTAEGFEVHIQVNHLSHFLLTGILLDSLKMAANARGEGRIVTHSSCFRYFAKYESKYLEKCEEGTLGGNDLNPRTMRYAHTKLCVAVFAYEFNRRISENLNVFAVVADPGLASTEVFNKGQNDSSLFQRNKNLYISSGIEQSAADGAMPLGAAAFSNDVGRGDFLVPSKWFNVKGLPTKAIVGGKSNWYIYGEKNVLDEEVGESLWEMSEKATNFVYTF